MEYTPSPYVTWIKHLSDFSGDQDVFYLDGGEVTVLAHPRHKKIKFDTSKKLYAQIDAKDKTLQLYFYSLGWVVAALSSRGVDEYKPIFDVLEQIFDIESSEERTGSWNMLWDDHAICERLCVLLEVKRVITRLGIGGFEHSESLLFRISDHVSSIRDRLSDILSNDKWKNNNHRLFHLLAAYVYSVDSEGSTEAELYKKEIEDFVCFLIDLDTGFSIEQSISYCFFDIDIAEKVLLTVSTLSSSPTVDIACLKENLNSHIAAISFPDGTLPASGDTPLGKKLSSYQKKHAPSQDRLHQHWENLERMGYFRGCSSDHSSHFLMLSHCSESAHGHFSPLHADLWLEGVGSVVVDSGGPYKYGDKERYNWFRANRGHNSLSDKNGRMMKAREVSLKLDEEKRSAFGFASFENAFHSRMVVADSGLLTLFDSVYADFDWEVFINFHYDFKVESFSEGEFLLINKTSDRFVKAKVVGEFDIELLETKRCVGHSKYQLAPSLRFSSPGKAASYKVELSVG